MATVPHVTSGLGLRKFQADGFLLTRVYKCLSAVLWWPLTPQYRQSIHLLIVLFRLFTWTSVLWINIVIWMPAAEGSGDFLSPFPLPIGTAGRRHLSMPQALWSVFRCSCLWVEIPFGNSARRIYYRLYLLVVSSNRETTDSNPPDNCPRDCLKHFPP